MLKRILSSSVMMVVAVWVSATFAGPVDITGTWVTIDDEDNEPASHVEIRMENDTVRGTIVHLIKEPDATCDDCEGELKGKPALGMEIIRDMLWDEKDGRYEGGRILDPGNGKWYRCFLKLLPDGRLEVRGFIGIALLGRSQYWVRKEGS